MLRVKAYAVVDHKGNFFCESIRSTRVKAIKAFLDIIELPKDKKRWVRFKENGYECKTIFIRVVGSVTKK